MLQHIFNICKLFLIVLIVVGCETLPFDPDIDNEIAPYYDTSLQKTADTDFDISMVGDNNTAYFVWKEDQSKELITLHVDASWGERKFLTKDMFMPKTYLRMYAMNENREWVFTGRFIVYNNRNKWWKDNSYTLILTLDKTIRTIPGKYVIIKCEFFHQVGTMKIKPDFTYNNSSLVGRSVMGK